jgi:hypothetical protein
MAKVFSLDANGNTIEITGKSSSAGAADAGVLVQLGSDGKIDASALPNGIGADATSYVASEAIAAGAFVNITSDGKMRNASATAVGMKAIGYVNQAVASGASGTVNYDDTNTALTGLTPGITYFLSASTPGGVTNVPVTASGQILQKLGVATSATSIHANIQEPIIRA